MFWPFLAFSSMLIWQHWCFVIAAQSHLVSHHTLSTVYLPTTPSTPQSLFLSHLAACAAINSFVAGQKPAYWLISVSMCEWFHVAIHVASERYTYARYMLLPLKARLLMCCACAMNLFSIAIAIHLLLLFFWRLFSCGDFVISFKLLIRHVTPLPLLPLRLP